MGIVPVFLDTSALQHQYLDSPYSFRVRQLVAKAQGACYVADLTILEIASTLARQCRKRAMTLGEHDALDVRFFRDLKDGTVKVRKATPREVLRARKLIRFAKMIKDRNLSGVDALVALMCLELALETRDVVSFYTSDWTQYATIREIGAFRVAVNLKYLGNPKGGVPATTNAKKTATT